MDKRFYIDSHLFNFEECMFGGKNENWGSIKFSGDSILNLTDGSVYRCCGVFGNYVSVINDIGGKVSVKAIMEWTSGRKKKRCVAEIQLLEDLTEGKYLEKVLNEGKGIFPQPNEPRGGITFPTMLICSRNETEKPIAIYPDPTPETLKSQREMISSFAEAIAPIILEKIKQKKIGVVDDVVIPTKKSNLQVLRERLNLSQSELSKLSGVTLQIIKRYELPESNLKTAKGETLLALSKSLKCPIEELLT